jgi:hypothetical protein
VFAEVQETLACLRCPGGIVVGDLLLLTMKIARKALELNWLTAEPEVLLLETNQLPIEVCMLIT